MNMVTVIGGGPAGLITARKCQEMGWKTSVLEEHNVIGNPVNCTGIISATGVEDVGIRKEVEETLVNKIKGAQIYSPNHEMIEVKKSSTVAYVIDRKEFDRVLAREATEAGVEINLNTKMIDIRNETIFTEYKGRGGLQKSKLIVGADGVNSKTRSLMGFQTNIKNYVHGYQVIAKGNFDPKCVQIYMGDYSKGFFAWIVPENEEQARIGLASTSKNIRKDFEMFVNEKNISGEFCDRCSSLIPVGEPLKNIVHDNMLLVGDSAFQTKATSIDYEEPIVLLDEKGFIRNEKIGKLADKEFTNPKNEIISSENYEIAVPKKEIRAFSPDEKAKKNGFREIKNILRHKIEEDLYEIILEKGYRVKATASHSVMVATKNSFSAKYTDKLQQGKDIMALNTNIPKGRIIKEINIIKELMEKCPETAKKIMVHGLKEKIYQNYKEVEKGKASQYYYKNIIPLTKFLEKGIRPQNTKISLYKGSLFYEDKLPITKELCRLLGYFAAEGSYKENNLTITMGIEDKKKGYLEDAVKCIQKGLGVRPEKITGKKNPENSKETAYSLTFGGEIAKNLFQNVFECGIKAKGKQIPWIIFNIEEELKKEFLKGYLRGDGTIRIRENKNRRHRSIELSAKTVSRKMASDLVLLSFQLGLFPSIESEKPKNRRIFGKEFGCLESYRITFSRKKDMHELKNIFPEKEKKIEKFIQKMSGRETQKIPKELLETKNIKQELLKEFGNSYESYKNLGSQRLVQVFSKTKNNDNEFIKNILTQKIILLKVKEIRKVKTTDSNVFDVEIPETQMFTGGIGPILLHNTGGGIILGAEAGKIAADSINAYFKDNKPLKNYEKNCSELNKELRLHWKIRQFLNSKNEEQLDRLFQRMEKAKIGEFLSEHGDMDRPSRFVGKILTKPNMWRLFPEALKFMRT
ncbi:MAG: geranylgeranyl reductase family protein [Candidatus Diapherotrites archaeon]